MALSTSVLKTVMQHAPTMRTAREFAMPYTFDDMEPQIPDMPLTSVAADQVIARACVDSTNAFARRLIQSGSLFLAAPMTSGSDENNAMPERCVMYVVIADMQIAGHGRLGRH